MNIQYKALDILMIPKLATAYKDVLMVSEGKEMSEIHQSNLLKFIIDNFTNQEFLFLTACSGKKIAGFAIVIPTPSLDSTKTSFVDPFWVSPEYRNQGIGKSMVDMILGWCKKRGIKRLMGSEKPDGNTWSKKQHLGMRPYRTLLIREV